MGDSSWEEVCAMGKNLWQLLVAPALPAASQSPQRMPISESPSKQPQTRNPMARHESPPKETEPWPVTLGHFSHGTAHSFLAAAGGTDHMRDWRLQSPVKVIEKVKAMLLSERTGAEWEILEGNEWEEEAGIGHTENGEGRQEEGTVDGVEGESKGKGASGWMKVKSRTGT